MKIPLPWDRRCCNYYGADMSPDEEDELVEGYQRLRRGEALTPLRKYLVRKVFKVLQFQKSEMGSNLLDVIRVGVRHHYSPIGIVLPDPDAVDAFQVLFDPLVEDRHFGFDRKDEHPDVDWGDWRRFGNLDPDCEIIKWIYLSVSRNLEGYHFTPTMTPEELSEVEGRIITALDKLPGEYMGDFDFIQCMPHYRKAMLEEENCLFDCGGKYTHTANISRYWSYGRSVFVNKDRSFFVWINAKDHLRVFSSQPGGDLRMAYRQICNVMPYLDCVLTPVKHDRLGYLTVNPDLLGCGLSIAAQVRMPGMPSAVIEHVAKIYHLHIEKILEDDDTNDFYMVTGRSRLGWCEFDVMKDFQHGLRELRSIVHFISTPSYSLESKYEEGYGKGGLEFEGKSTKKVGGLDKADKKGPDGGKKSSRGSTGMEGWGEYSDEEGEEGNIRQSQKKSSRKESKGEYSEDGSYKKSKSHRKSSRKRKSYEDSDDEADDGKRRSKHRKSSKKRSKNEEEKRRSKKKSHGKSNKKSRKDDYSDDDSRGARKGKSHRSSSKISSKGEYSDDDNRGTRKGKSHTASSKKSSKGEHSDDESRGSRKAKSHTTSNKKSSKGEHLDDDENRGTRKGKSHRTSSRRGSKGEHLDDDENRGTRKGKSHRTSSRRGSKDEYDDEKKRTKSKSHGKSRKKGSKGREIEDELRHSTKVSLYASARLEGSGDWSDSTTDYYMEPPDKMRIYLMDFDSDELPIKRDSTHDLKNIPDAPPRRRPQLDEEPGEGPFGERRLSSAAGEDHKGKEQRRSGTDKDGSDKKKSKSDSTSSKKEREVEREGEDGEGVVRGDEGGDELEGEDDDEEGNAKKESFAGGGHTNTPVGPRGSLYSAPSKSSLVMNII